MCSIGKSYSAPTHDCDASLINKLCAVEQVLCYTILGRVVAACGMKVHDSVEVVGDFTG